MHRRLIFFVDWFLLNLRLRFVDRIAWYRDSALGVRYLNIGFVELDRNEDSAKNIMELLEELMNVTDQKIEDWRVRYYKSHKETYISLEALHDLIPSSPEAYEKAYGNEEIDKLKSAAGVDVTTKAPKNDYTESLRNLAGIIR